MPLTYRDSGVFLYIGSQILNGELPYQDVWDHKPPAIFYINALGLMLSNHSRWGVWALEFVSLFITTSIGFYLLKKVFGFFPAICSILLGLITLLFVIQGGNLTTEYTLPLQFLTLWLVSIADRPNSLPWRWFLIGLVGGLAFFTKQTSVGLWIAIVVYLMTQLKRDQIKRLRPIVYLSGGVLLVCSAIIFLFSLQGGLAEFWNAAFKYSLIYTTAATPLTSRLLAFLMGIAPLTKAGLMQFSAIGYGFGVLLIIFGKDFDRLKPLLLVGLIDLPIELIMIGLSGRAYPHYYMSLLPTLVLFAGLAFWVILSQLNRWGMSATAKLLFQLGLVGILAWCSLKSYRDQVAVFRQVGDYTVVNYVESHVAPDAYVLMWGAETSVNFFADRRSPTRFAYQFPLYAEGYVDEQMILEFLDDVAEKRPLIIDTRNPLTPMFNFPIQTEAIKERVAHLQAHYHSTHTLNDWTVYEYGENLTQIPDSR